LLRSFPDRLFEFDTHVENTREADILKRFLRNPEDNTALAESIKTKLIERIPLYKGGKFAVMEYDTDITDITRVEALGYEIVHNFPPVLIDSVPAVEHLLQGYCKIVNVSYTGYEDDQKYWSLETLEDEDLETEIYTTINDFLVAPEIAGLFPNLPPIHISVYEDDNYGVSVISDEDAFAVYIDPDFVRGRSPEVIQNRVLYEFLGAFLRTSQPQYTVQEVMQHRLDELGKLSEVPLLREFTKHGERGEVFKSRDFSREKDLREIALGMHTLDSWSLSGALLEEVFAIYTAHKDSSELKQEAALLKRKLLNQIVIENNTIITCEERGDDVYMSLQRAVESQKLPDGTPVYKVRDALVSPVDFGPQGVIAVGKALYFLSNDSVWKYEHKRFSSEQAIFRNGLRISHDLDNPFTDHIRQEVRTGLAEVLKIPDKLETSVGINFGGDIWETPERFHMDVYQNHARQGGVRMEFYVSVNGTRTWQAASEYTGPNDQIIGLRYSDHGKGYAPNTINILGESEATHPLEPGQFGEGIKMLSASALRLSWLDLRFRSMCIENGQVVNWEASPTVVTKVSDKQQSHGLGEIKATEKQMLGFNIQKTHAQPFSSATEMFFNKSEGQGFVEWQKFIAAVRPDTNTQTMSDLSVTELKKAGQKTYTSGLVEFIPGLKGVYENGLKVLQKVEEGIGGFNVPRVGVNRERTNYDPKIFREILSQTINECADVVFMREIIRASFGPTGNITPEGIEFWRNLDVESPQYPKLWKQIFQDCFPGKYLYSPEVLKAEAVRGDRYLYTMFMYGWFKSQILIASSPLYMNISRIFPTVEEMAYKTAELEVEHPEENMEFLEKEITKLAHMVTLWLEEEKQKGDASVVVYYLHEEFTKAEALASIWASGEPMREKIRVMSSRYVALGESTGDGMNFNELLFLPENAQQFLRGIILHELIHEVTGFRDFEQDFVILLKSLGDFAKTHNFE